MEVRCGRGCSWKDGRDVGHCSGCHRTFDSLEAFDRHQSIKNDRVVCADPAKRRWFTSQVREGVTYWRRAR